MRPFTTIGRLLAGTLLCGFSMHTVALGQGAHGEGIALDSSLIRASHVVVPQARGFALSREWNPIHVEAVDARVKIVEQASTTTLEVTLANPGGRDAEAVLLLPVPETAVVHSFAFDGPASEPRAELLPREEARRLYDSIVAKVRDPALLEFAGSALVRSSLFPVPAHGHQRIRLTYEHLLEGDGNRVDYVLPRSESLTSTISWRIALDIHSKTPISMLYSPTHDIVTSRENPHHVRVSVSESSHRSPGSFLLSWLREGAGMSASLFAYPDPKVGGGYFLLMAGLPVDAGAPPIPREVTLVIDRSGSMAGPKMDQVRAAALQIIEGLDDGEAFNIIDYATTVAAFAKAPVAKDRPSLLQARRYLSALRPTGGTNIHDALVEALRQPAREGMLPLVLFLTDGLPTVGTTSELAIRQVVIQGNRHERRIFTFGVGTDVNAPLLDFIADSTRATSTYVLPEEDVETKVGQVFRRLKGPVLTQLCLEALDAQGHVTTRQVRELIPSRLPDLFEGDPLIVLGQYVGEGPLHFRLDASHRGKPRQFAFEFTLASATTRNAFVPRLWAGRRIAYLVDQIRQLGDAGRVGFTAATPTMADPRIAELSGEILRLSAEFGILSEYTAFLAREGTDLSRNWEGLTAMCGDELHGKALQVRHGTGAVSQARNFNARKAQVVVDGRNQYWDEKLERVESTTVQQIADRAFFRCGAQWVDSRLVAGNAELRPDEIIELGSPAHLRLLQELVTENRQGMLSLSGDTLIEHRGKRVLIVNGQE
ncbi:MAG: VIT domain-containing protein [Planctomycetota bacterium]